MQQYIVIGIVQLNVNGAWYEQPVKQSVRAESRGAAKQAVLDTFQPHFARWHTPELVQVSWGS